MWNPDCNYLIVDDSEIDRIITSRLLKVRMGATRMHFAEDGRKAIDLVRSTLSKLQQNLIILLDIQMPDMDGFEFLEEYEKMTESLKGRTQVFMLSSSIDPMDIERAHKHNFVTSLLGKPLLIEELILLVGATD